MKIESVEVRRLGFRRWIGQVHSTDGELKDVVIGSYGHVVKELDQRLAQRGWK